MPTGPDASVISLSVFLSLTHSLSLSLSLTLSPALKDTGLIAYINEHVSFKRLTRYEEYGVECVWFDVKLKKSSPILVGFIYRNPSEPANWVEKFVCMMDSVWLESKEIILMGDFNID